ncbi:sensor histidine kinase [Actinoplanes siamensis]|uniref:histidine kinase n=1 Tax=Actinoplanes siamensis TaxID=1223317 RepID=A0A919NA14_9ACTN|nr:histidine kinase [Actinoplanes siamensis]GIF07309.1 two-component sensor histidine kinase [Actinoplanes siamensis]
MRERGRDGRRWPEGRRNAWCSDAPAPPSKVPGEQPSRRRARGAHTGWPPGSAVIATVAHLVGANHLAEGGGLFRPWDPLTTVLLLIGPVALFWRRRAPIPVFVIASAASVLFATTAAPDARYGVAPAIALYSVARQGRRQAALICASTAWAVWLGVVAGLAGPLALDPGVRPSVGQACLAAAGLGLMILLGGAARIRAQNDAEQARTRAEQARAREEQRRRQASEERLRIARELHDVLGHHLSLINVQAGVGLHLMDQRPEQAREALTAIRSASAEALREVRAVLGVLRTEGEAAPRQPALGLNRLGELTASAGIPVRTTVTGEPRELPAEVDRAAYRIVQEALTNVRRHAAGPQPEADVAVGYLPAALYLSIRNGGPAGADDAGPARADNGGPAGADDAGLAEAEPAPSSSDGEEGSGIAGMRARAESLGGRLEAGRPPAGGFLVTVILPTGSVPAGPAAGRTAAGSAAGVVADPGPPGRARAGGAVDPGERGRAVPGDGDQVTSEGER